MLKQLDFLLLISMRDRNLELIILLLNILNTKKNVLSGYSNTEKWVEKRGFSIENEGENRRNLCKLRPCIQTSFTVVISFVFSS